MDKATIDKQRQKDSEVSRLHGNTPIGKLRGLLGQSFAPGIDANAKLGDVLQRIDDVSLKNLVNEMLN